ncbi:MAG TPA: SGNH/GDSL hydrolase family protein [Candidatus Saccharimonadales bacterium]|nr:SGNH/GDSL hydrolase family protein [Candidatus Saccharimonadales bacterium]
MKWWKRVGIYFVLAAVGTLAGLTFNLEPEATDAQSTRQYIALGDSVAAGAGLTPYGATAEGQLCNRSTQAYPYRVARSVDMDVQHLACSGAKADEGLYGLQYRQGVRLAPQLDQAFANGTPDLVTITIGGNDMRWSQFVRDCYTWNCGSLWDDFRAELYLADLQWELYRTMYEIDYRSQGQPPRVVLTGYFTPLGDLSCVPEGQVAPEETAWLQGWLDQLNGAIADAAAWYNFAQFAPVDFSDHGLCSALPWVQGLNDESPLHPTVAGQTAIARSVIRTINN